MNEAHMMPTIHCAVCDKTVDRVSLWPRFETAALVYKVWCHGDTDICEILDTTRIDAGSSLDLSRGVAFTGKRIEETKKLSDDILHNEVYNPHNLPEEELAVIYGFCNGSMLGALNGMLLGSDGRYMGCHVSTSEAWMLKDLGILHGEAPERHARFRGHYPRGYRMEFVQYDDVLKHPGLMAAYELNQKRPDPEPKRLEDDPE